MGDIQKAPLSECSMHLTSSGSLFSLPNQNEFSLLGFGHRLLPSNYFALGDCCSVTKSCLTLCDPMDYSTPGSSSSTVSWNLLTFMSIELVMLSNHLMLCYLLLFLPSIFPSIRVFSSESAPHIKWPKYWSFSSSPSNEYSGLVSFRMDWLDLLAVQGTLKSLLQHHSSKASILQHAAFFMLQFSHPYTTTGKSTALTIQTFISKVMSLLFNTLSRFVIAFPFKEQASFNFMAVVTVHSDFVAQENKSVTASTFPLLFTVKWWDWIPWS